MRRPILAIGLVALLFMLTAGAAGANGVPGGAFFDDDGNTHEGGIEAIAALGVTKGCNPPQNTEYCPNEIVTRGAMAAFLRRALNIPASNTDFFSDDNGSTFEADINAIAAAGITKGCNPPANTLYCPNDSVTRGAMAAFLVRAFGYSDNGGGNLFTDDDGSTFENDIDKLGTAGVTKGCNPPSNTRYCPNDPVVRDTMASFLSRALEIPAPAPPARVDTTLGSKLNLLVLAADQGCSAALDPQDEGITQVCHATTSVSSGDLFYISHGWARNDWSTLPSSERTRFASDVVRFDLALNGLQLDPFKSLDIVTDTAIKDYRFQFHGNLTATTHTLVGEWVDGIVELRIILDVTVTS